jgi:protein-S-isoprenylcysteine O-methyltransferase Ste14
MAEKPPLWAVLGTIVFILVVPGTLIGLVPYWLSGWVFGPPLLGWSITPWLGATLFCLALPVFVDFATRFVHEGLGTPAPIAPTRRLVVGGPFRYVRNPAYVSAVTMTAGQGLLLGSMPVLLYAAGLALGFHLFVVLYEEPTLRRSFGAEYEVYRRHVPRWIPRFTAAQLPEDRSRGIRPRD